MRCYIVLAWSYVQYKISSKTIIQYKILQYILSKSNNWYIVTKKLNLSSRLDQLSGILWVSTQQVSYISWCHCCETTNTTQNFRYLKSWTTLKSLLLCNVGIGNLLDKRSQHPARGIKGSTRMKNSPIIKQHNISFTPRNSNRFLLKYVKTIVHYISR